MTAAPVQAYGLGIDHDGEHRLVGLLSPSELADRQAEIQDRLANGLPPYEDDPEGTGPERPEIVERDETMWRETMSKPTAPTVPLSSSVSLSELLAEPDMPTPYRIEGLLPLGGRVVMAAQYKSGKTVTVNNLVRCLVDGDQFLARYSTAPVTGKVAIVDTEMDRGMLRRWLKEQGIARHDRVQVELLRGRLTEFDILSPTGRDKWVEHFRSLGVDVLILDCLRPILDAFGLNENTDAGTFLVAIDELAKRAGIRELVVVHHMGHGAERARGSSRLRDWPDVACQ